METFYILLTQVGDFMPKMAFCNTEIAERLPANRHDTRYEPNHRWKWRFVVGVRSTRSSACSNGPPPPPQPPIEQNLWRLLVDGRIQFFDTTGCLGSAGHTDRNGSGGQTGRC